MARFLRNGLLRMPLLDAIEREVFKIDLRKNTKEANSYFIVFCSRPASSSPLSVAGHAYVVLGKRRAKMQPDETLCSPTQRHRCPWTRSRRNQG